MKKFVVVLMTAIFLISMLGQCLAASSEAVNPEAEPVTLYGRIGTSANIAAFKVGSSIRSIYGTGLIRTGPCWVKSVSMSAPTAGDAAMIYNGIAGAPTGIEFELIISANNSNPPQWNAGAYFEHGIYVHATDSDVLTTVVFDY